jgi:hypothetical protein
MVFKFRRKETPWEVVDNHSVKPVPTYFEGKPGRGPHFYYRLLLPNSNVARRISYLRGWRSRHGWNVHLQCIQRVRHDDISTGSLFLSQTTVRGGIKKGLQRADSRKVIYFSSREKLVNSELISWSFTILRNGQRHRAEIRYTGRPARLSGNFTNKQKPPFISTLDRYFLYV